MGQKTLVACKAGDLTIIPHIQRRLNARRVTKLAAEWDDALVGTLEAAEIEWEGQFIWHVTDGQHRWAAAQRINPDYVFQVVVEHDLDEQDIARRFLARNQMSAKVPALDQYEVGLVAKDPVALDIEDSLARNGLHASGVPGDKAVAAVAAMMTIVRRGNASGTGGRRVLRETLDIVLQAWPDADGTRFNGDILKGIGYLMAKYGASVDQDRLIGKLRERAPDVWAIDAKALSKAISGGGEGRATLLMGLFREAYNYRLSKARKLV